MCGRYSLGSAPAAIADRFGLEANFPDATGRYNIAPTEQVLAIVEDDGRHHAELMRWGLVPPWSKDLKSSFKMINARVETAAENAAYRKLVPRAARRALQVADGYYEWLKPEHRGAPRQPFHFQVDGGALFAFAALWTPAKIDGEWIHSITLLTCDSSSNATAAAIHDRMPVILADADAQRAWLDPNVGVEALELCQPLPADRLTARPANPAVNKAGDRDDAGLLVYEPAAS
jgi:putative SOS response-associated peptidase YedK